METHEISLSEFKEFVKELTEVKGKVERVEGHLRKYDLSMEAIKEEQNKQTKILNSIDLFFNGNSYTGEKGFAVQFKEMKEQQEMFKEMKIKHEVYFGIMGVVIVALLGGLATALFKLFLQ